MPFTRQHVIVLNVDGAEVERQARTRVLEQAGFEVVEADGGAAALELIGSGPVGIVLLDSAPADMDAVELVQRIKRTHPGVLVLQTSAGDSAGIDRARSLDGGADSYLARPIEDAELLAALRALQRIGVAEMRLRNLNDTLEQRIEARTTELAKANHALRNEIVQRTKAEAALVQMQKMEAIGHLTGGIAHDFNNLLTAVVGSLDLIRARSSDPRIVRLADNALAAADRGVKLTSQLLAFSRTQKLAAKPVDANEVIRNMGDLLAQSLSAGIGLELQLASEPLVALADANQLELAVLNLAINARDAMPNGGTLSITTRIETLDAAEGELAAGSYVAIGVADTGTGMPPDVVARAFDPFFTTKPVGKGTGLGLAQVYGIARQFGGGARIDSTVGAGTRVTLRLPLIERAVGRGPAASGEEPVPEAAHRILVVDDDPDVRGLIADFLAELGYAVVTAEGGEQGLALLDEMQPELLIVDYAMPRMNGAEFITRARMVHPRVGILFVSGYADSKALETAAAGSPVIKKPFRPAELAAAVQDALASRT